MTPERDDGSRVEAAEAGIHAEQTELAEGRQPEEHVTATEAATVDAAPALHHHPPDPNSGVVRGRVGRGGAIAGLLAAAVTVAAVVLLALAVRGSG